MEEEKILRLIIGQVSPEEKEELLNWVSGSTENREEYYRLKNMSALIAQSGTTLKAEENEIIKFRQKIHKEKLKRIRSRIVVYTRYAAVILIAFFAGKFIFQNKKAATDNTGLYNQVIVPPGQIVQVVLPDGTNVFVNSCSRLTYPVNFAKKEREVVLSGEAYFSVAKSKIPFLVKTDKKIVKVLGTKFDVMSYPKDNLYQTTLFEGKILLLDTIGKELAELKPGEQYTFDIAENRQSVKSVDIRIYDSWKDGIYIFDHETLGELAKTLERVFNVKINIQNTLIRNYKFSGTISRNIPFEQILKIIQISAPIKYKIRESHGAIEEVTLY